MSVIAAKAINGSMGTANYKGLDEVIKAGFRNLVPRTITKSHKLNSNGEHQNVEISLGELLDLERTSIDLVGAYSLEENEYIAPYIYNGKENLTGRDCTIVRIYYRFLNNNLARQATVRVTTYSSEV